MHRHVIALVAGTTLFALSAYGTAEESADVHLVRGAFAPPAQPDGNSVIITAPDGLIIIDTGRHAAHTQRIVDYVRKQTLGSQP